MTDYEKRLKRLAELLKTDIPDRQPMIDRFTHDLHKIYGSDDQPPATISQDEFGRVVEQTITKIYGGKNE